VHVVLLGPRALVERLRAKSFEASASHASRTFARSDLSVPFGGASIASHVAIASAVPASLLPAIRPASARASVHLPDSASADSSTAQLVALSGSHAVFASAIAASARSS